MLETLHRYLMIPGVIIMLSYNYLDLYQGCEKHFYELFHKSQKMGDKEESYVQELAVLPRSEPSQVIARVCSFCRGEREVSCGSFFYRMYAVIRVETAPLRSVLVRVKNRLFR